MRRSEISHFKIMKHREHVTNMRQEELRKRLWKTFTKSNFQRSVWLGFASMPFRSPKKSKIALYDAPYLSERERTIQFRFFDKIRCLSAWSNSTTKQWWIVKLIVESFCPQTTTFLLEYAFMCCNPYWTLHYDFLERLMFSTLSKKLQEMQLNFSQGQNPTASSKIYRIFGKKINAFSVQRTKFLLPLLKLLL